MLTTRPKKTVDDYWKLPDDTRCELLRGDFYMSPSPNSRHQRAVLNLATRLHLHVEANKLGQVFVSPFDCVLSQEDVVQPDVLFVSTANLTKIRDWLFGAPDLAIEVLSPWHAERDRIVKRDLYAERGVQEYWIADVEARTIEVFVLDSGRFRGAGVFGAEDTLRSHVLPSLDMRVGAVLE